MQADYSDLFPTALCPCGSNMFKAIVHVDTKTYEIEFYSLDNECAECGSKIKMACPVDLENYVA